MPPPPRPPRAAVAAVRAALAAAGFRAAALDELLGPPDPRLAPPEQEALWAWRARGATPLAVLARIFLLQHPVPAEMARRALGPLAPWRALGLLAVRDGVARPRAQLSVHGGLVVASDPLRGRPSRGHVLGPTAATLTLERLLLPVTARRALDLGTGSGYLALRLAARAGEVVASDLSPRALAWARLGAALAGADDVRFVRGDRFAAVGRARFDLIVGNLPFVVSPAPRFTYRDAAGAGDAFLESVVRATGRHLVEGGVAQYLGQWVHRAGEDEEVRIASWLVAAGCDGIVLRLERDPADLHAARWSGGPGALHPRARARRLRRWAEAFARDGVQAVSTGLFTLRRRRTGRHVMLIEDAPPGMTGPQLLAWLSSL